MDETQEHKDDENKKAVLSYPLVQMCDMDESMRNEIIEIIMNACDKFGTNYFEAPKEMKEILDKKYRPKWHAVIGEAFGVHTVHRVNNMMYMFLGPNLGICVWKS